MTSPQETASWEQVLRLLHEGHGIESIVSGWRIPEERLAELIIAGFRAGERVEAAWLVPASLKDRLLETLDARPELSPVQVSSLFKGRVSPPLVHALKVIRGGGRGLETRVYNEDTYFERLHDDLHAARSEILIVAPAVKGRHWRRFADAYRRVLRNDGQVAFFVGRISELIDEQLKDERIVLIEKRTHANLAVIDGRILWEGSMNFLLPPDGEEHVRRSVSRLMCDEVKELHDLFV